MSSEISIEFAQPYESDDPAISDSLGAAALSALTEQLQRDRIDYSLVALVDDYTGDHKDTADLNSYADWLKDKGFDVSVVARETEIQSNCETVLSMLDLGKLSPELQDIMAANVYISPLFIATWCLMRLGYIQQETISKQVQGEKLINILPETFKPDEDRSLEIIRATPFAEAADKIEYIFISY